MTIELQRVHLQRLRGAVDLARAGGNVIFIVLQSEPPTVAWRDTAKPRTQHVILCAWGKIEDWLALVQAEFDRQTKKSHRKAQ